MLVYIVVELSMSLLCYRVQLATLVLTFGVPFSFTMLPDTAPRTSVSSSAAPIPDDPEADRFVAELMSKMTLSEKLGQMTQIAINGPSDGVSFEEHIRNGEVGSFQSTTNPELINRLQHIAVEQSRLHIPLSFAFDVVHGLRTIYPVPLALAASWDPALVEHAQEMAAHEASAVGINWTFAPMLDIARDPRWGRIMEGAGEDPYLGSRMAEAQVRGFQGDHIGAPHHLLACLKHFAGYGAAAGGRDYEESNISEEQLENVYLPPFQAGVNAGAGSLMSGYMDLNGVPGTGNRWLLHDILRDRWHFAGFVVSDWRSVENLTTHGFASDQEDAAARAVNAGLDMEMVSHLYRDMIPGALQDGRVKQGTIDQAVRNILLIKYRLGLFEHPYADLAEVAKQLVTPEQREAALTAATRTAVLLRNQDGLLPFGQHLYSIAVVGPLADSKADTMGSWSLGGHYEDTVTVLEGLRKRSPPGVAINFSKGVEISRDLPSIFDDQFQSPKPTLTTESARRAEFRHAIGLIQQSDVAVLVLGERQDMSGERASRSSLALPGQQQQLLEAAVATGKPIVLVLLNGRPLDITWASEHVPAILEVWYPGTEGGNAVANLLFGSAVPGGHLPFAWPRSIGQIPINYARNVTQIPEDPDHRYWDSSSLPLYPFGYGLSYTSFTVGKLKLSATSTPAGSSFTVSVNVTNTGKLAGDEVVQLYTHQRSGSASRPIRELKGFQRIRLGPGENRTLMFVLDTNELSFWSPQTHQRSIEPGIFDLWAGADANAAEHSSFTITD
jgi:beta-glucosidase